MQEFDGASRGNPGPAGAGAALLEGTDGSQVCMSIMLPGCHSFNQPLACCLLQVGSICLNLGIMTNNQAEYYGLLAGLEACKAVGVRRISVRGDSQLVVKQVKLKAKGIQVLML